MPLPPDAVRVLAAELLAPSRWVVAPPLRLAWTHGVEEVPWEVFQGRLLEPAHTRRRQTFESWNVHELTDDGPSPEPVVSLKLDAAARRLFVVRGVDSYVWQGYDQGGGVYLSRETRRWVRELIATFDLTAFADLEELRVELVGAVHRAVVGARLPLTAVEAPLPLFSFGRLYYPDATQPARGLEARLRTTPIEDIPAVLHGWQGAALLAALRRVFADVSLSPWTDFTARVLRLLAAAEEGGLLDGAQVVDFEGWLLRLLGRHLTAYDLVTFHHRGANYPDALLLEEVLADFLVRLERTPALFAGDAARLRRRALRQAWLIRRRYEGHPVPDTPTSPGEHLRVFPPGHPRVPEEQILQPGRRRRWLFADDPLSNRLTPIVRAALLESVADLAHPDERQELGAGVFLDRPFGGAKAPVEPDATPLLASLAYSRSVATQRLRLLASDLDLAEAQAEVLPGLPLERIGPALRPGTVGLNDAARAASDFVFRFTLPGGVRGLWRFVDPPPSWPAGTVLLARATDGPGLVVHDETRTPCLELEPRLEEGYRSREGIEFPAAGLRARSVGGEWVVLRPR